MQGGQGGQGGQGSQGGQSGQGDQIIQGAGQGVQDTLKVLIYSKYKES